MTDHAAHDASTNAPVGQEKQGCDQVGWKLEATYASLPSPFFALSKPTPVARPEVLILNYPLAVELGLNLDGMDLGRAAQVFSGNELPVGAVPIAQAYAGHQYGGFTMLGDGRAILLGEQRTPDGRLVDIQFKGSGPTKYSRRGDGRAAVGPMLREYIISEAMFAFGIPTTRSLAVVSTGEPVYRDEALPGAVLTRVATSHIRVGTFQYFAALRDPAGLRRLADYTIERHFSELVGRTDRHIDLLRNVQERQASLLAHWMRVGFVHGVMNTDNVSVCGETIDYGPCAFLDRYHPNTVFSSIDHGGRYAFGNQPTICHWNLVRFAESILPLLHEDEKEAIRIATEILERFPYVFEAHWIAQMGQKLGLLDADPSDKPLFEELLHWMSDELLDYTQTFNFLTEGVDLSREPWNQSRFLSWYQLWKARLERAGRTASEIAQTMQAANPFLIPRNHRVEEALDAVTFQNDLKPLQRLLQAIASPYARNANNASFTTPPEPNQQAYRTFCGT